MDIKKLWDTMKTMTYMNTDKKHLITMNDEECAKNLNDFFLRFDSQNECDFATAVNINYLNDIYSFKIDQQSVQAIFGPLYSLSWR